MRLIVQPEAEDDLADAAEYMERHSPHQMDRFLTDVAKMFLFVAAAPGAGRRIEGEVRGFPLHTFRYDVVYEVREGDIYVLAVSHHRRDPADWQNRF